MSHTALLMSLLSIYSAQLLCLSLQQCQPHKPGSWDRVDLQAADTSNITLNELRGDSISSSKIHLNCLWVCPRPSVRRLALLPPGILVPSFCPGLQCEGRGPTKEKAWGTSWNQSPWWNPGGNRRGRGGDCALDSYLSASEDEPWQHSC